MSKTLHAASGSATWMLIALALFAAPRAYAQAAVFSEQHASLERFAHVFATQPAPAIEESSTSRNAGFIGPMPAPDHELADPRTSSARAGRKLAPAGEYDKYIQPGNRRRS